MWLKMWQSANKIWKLPYDCSSLNVAVVSNTVPIYDELCRQVINCVHSCLHCDSYFVKSIVLNATGMNSPIRRNVAHCSAHFNLNIGCIGISKLSCSECFEICNNRMNTPMVARANDLQEALMIRDGLLEFSRDLFQYSNFLNWAILLSCWQVDLLSFMFNFSLFSWCCTSCTIFIIN